jgi:hypothetical protein
MDRLNDRIRCRRQKAIDQVGTGERLRLCAAIALEFGPDAGKGEQRPIIVEREPDDVLLLGLRVRLRRVLREAVHWDQASVFRLQPTAPVR